MSEKAGEDAGTDRRGESAMHVIQRGPWAGVIVTLFVSVTSWLVAVMLGPRLPFCLPVSEKLAVALALVLAAWLVAFAVARPSGPSWRTVGVGALVTLAGAATCCEGITGALDRGAQKRSMGDLRTIGSQVQTWRDEGRLPANAGGLVSELAPLRGEKVALPVRDGWGGAYRFSIREGSYRVWSCGLCGEPDAEDVWSLAPGPTSRLSADIVYENGSFVRWLGGGQE